MQKTAFVLVPIAVLAVLALVFFKVLRRDPADARPDSTSSKAAADPATTAELTRLRAELETLRKESEAQKKRAEAAEAKLSTTAAEGASSVAPADAPKAAAKKGGDWKRRRDAELEAKVKSMEWKKNVKGLIDYWKELEKSRAEGRAPRMDPDMVERLTQLTKDAGDLHAFLGMEGKNVWDSFGNELVQEAWMDAMLHDLTGGTVTEEQLARLRNTPLYRTDDPDFRGGNILEGWKELMEYNKSYTRDTAGVLTPEQSSQVSQGVPPTFMLRVYAQYAERTLSGAGAVTDYWLESFKVGAEQRAAVEPVAADFAKQLSQLTQTYTQQYGATLPRDADFEYRLKALELQIAAEKKLGESLQLDADQLKKLLKGSGSVIKLAQ